MNSLHLKSIRTFEGFTAQAQWDYAQHSNGYGTRALYPGEVIDRAEAERRFQSEIASARAVVERHAANADEGTKAALTSLTFNAGEKWTRDGLGDAVRRGDMDAVRSLFVEYNKAGGKLLAGLAARRAAEAEWIGSPPANVGQAAEPPIAPASELAALLDRTTSEPMAPGQGYVAAETSDRQFSMTGGAGLGPVSSSQEVTSPLLLSLRLHMALAASSRFAHREGTREDDRQTPEAKDSVRS
ncbi:MAG: glycoside hydrolase family protein [Hyphomicrobiaceae bacterium]|jgi:lysozyme